MDYFENDGDPAFGFMDNSNSNLRNELLAINDLWDNHEVKNNNTANNEVKNNTLDSNLPFEFDLPDDENNRDIDNIDDLDDDELLNIDITNNDNKVINLDNNNNNNGGFVENSQGRYDILNTINNQQIDQLEVDIFQKRTELMAEQQYKKAYKLFKLKVGKKRNMVGPNEYKYYDNSEDIDLQKPIFDRLSNIELKEYKRKHNKKEQKRRVQVEDTRPVSRTNFSFSEGRWKYFKYQNRHLVVPQDVDYESYYKIDSRAKNKADQGTWVKILSPKWATNYHRYVWKCQELVSNKILFATYIDGTSQMSSDDPRVQAWFRAKYTQPTLCLTIPQQQVLITKLKQMIQLFEQPRKIGYRGEREHGDDNDGNRLNIRENGLNRERGFGEEDFQDDNNHRERKRPVQKKKKKKNRVTFNLSNMNDDDDDDDDTWDPDDELSPINEAYSSFLK